MISFPAPRLRELSLENFNFWARCIWPNAYDLTAIWGRIKGQVLHSLWTELGALYDGPQDPEFRTMVKLGVQVKLDNLTDFQKNIQESAGYHQYCSQLIRHTLFGRSVPLPKLP